MIDGLFFSTLGLGLAFSATPGAVNAEALRRGLARGFRPALLVQCGSLVGDLCWVALALTGAAFLAEHASVRLALGVAGALFLLRMACAALRDAWRGDTPAASTAGASGRGDFATGALFSLTSPFAVAFWLGLGGGIVATANAHPHAATVATFFAGFGTGALAWCVCSSALLAWGRRFATAGLFRWLNAACGAALGYIGVRVLLRTLRAARVARLVLG